MDAIEAEAAIEAAIVPPPEANAHMLWVAQVPSDDDVPEAMILGQVAVAVAAIPIRPCRVRTAMMKLHDVNADEERTNGNKRSPRGTAAPRNDANARRRTDGGELV